MAEEKRVGDKNFALGNEAFVDEDYEQAIEHYTAAINLQNDNPDYFLKRCFAHIKMDNIDEALKDSEECLKYNDNSAKAWERKGFCLFSMEKYDDALQAYTRALAVDENSEKIQQAIRKCEAEINLLVSEAPENKDDKIKVGFSKMQCKAQTQKAEIVTNCNGVTSQQPPSMSSKIKYDWYQTETHVILTVLAKKLKNDDVKVDFGEQMLSVTAKLPSGSDYSLELDLAHKINSSESNFKVLSTKVEIKMKKIEGLRWSSLETDNETQYANAVDTVHAEQPATDDDVHKYPSSRHGTDWDKLAKELQDEEKKENLEGDAALNKLFQQIYSDGSDEVKRAMNKSFQESGGTVLSTNWKDIKKEKVDVKPPDCMEYKQYEY